MGLNRLTDWNERFMGEVMASRDRPFHYGIHDCCMFACDLTKAITGVDVGAKFRGYRGRAEMEAVIAKHGSIEKMLESSMKEYGCDEIPIEMVRQGDKVLLNTEHGDAMGVVADADAKTAIVTGIKSGWTTIPIKNARRAWRIG